MSSITTWKRVREEGTELDNLGKQSLDWMLEAKDQKVHKHRMLVNVFLTGVLHEQF